MQDSGQFQFISFFLKYDRKAVKPDMVFCKPQKED